MTTVKRDGNFFEVTAIGADVSSADIFGDDNAFVSRRIKRIEFIGGANNDILVVREDNTNGATISTLATPDVEIPDRVYFDGGQYMKPFIDKADSTLSANHKVVIEVE